MPPYVILFNDKIAQGPQHTQLAYEMDGMQIIRMCVWACARARTYIVPDAMCSFRLPNDCCSDAI